MSATRRLVLASASPARLGLLRTAGFAPEVVVSGFDESSIHAGSLTDLVGALADAKATMVASRSGMSGAVIVGCDSLLDVDGTAHGKPSSIDDARTRLRGLRGLRELPRHRFGRAPPHAESRLKFGPWRQSPTPAGRRADPARKLA